MCKYEMIYIFLLIALFSLCPHDIYALNNKINIQHIICKDNNIGISLNKKARLLCNEENTEEGQNIKAYLSFQNKTFYLDTYYPEGDKANIEFAFIKKLHDMEKKELIVVISWNQRIKYISEGTLYA